MYFCWSVVIWILEQEVTILFGDFLKLVVFTHPNIVYYFSAPCRYGDVRLAGGHSEYEGRVEFCSSRPQWGSVCNTQWTEANSQIVCRSLGYSDVGEAYSHLLSLIIKLVTLCLLKLVLNMPNISQLVLSVDQEIYIFIGSPSIPV